MNITIYGWSISRLNVSRRGTFAAPRPVRGALTVSKLLLRLTLDPAADRQRIRQLELARGQVIEHSAALLRRIDVAQRDECLFLQVSDDGSGGASARPGSGLAGLAERVWSVDGTLSLHSPPGGPTLVTAMLPFRV